MKATGIRQERETVINWNEEDDQATIWTASDVVYRRLKKRLGTDYLVKDEERHAEFRFPKTWLVLPRKRVKAARPFPGKVKSPDALPVGGKSTKPEGVT